MLTSARTTEKQIQTLADTIDKSIDAIMANAKGTAERAIAEHDAAC